MKKISLFFSLALLAGLLFFAGCVKPHDTKALRNFNQVNLVDNNPAYNAAFTDPGLLNAWGLAFNTGGVAWVNSQGGHVSAVYDKEGATLRPAVAIPSPGGATGGNPTGIVFNAGTDFVLSNGAPARFIFVGVDGILSGWSSGNNALVVKNNSATSSYTGLTLAANAGANYLYAADFKARKIVVWDKNFAPVSMPFRDPSIPNGYAPFNIQVVGTSLYVMYAKVGSDGRDEPGVGKGYVSVFSTSGQLLKRFAARGSLNAPWGVTMAPASFFGDMNDDDEDDHGGHGNSDKGHGGHGNDDFNQPVILVGNFGDGRINAYTLGGDFLGQVKTHGHAITIDGLWALSFAPATATAVDPNRLYFTAGPNEEKDGLFGYLIKE